MLISPVVEKIFKVDQHSNQKMHLDEYSLHFHELTSPCVAPLPPVIICAKFSLSSLETGTVELLIYSGMSGIVKIIICIGATQ